MSHNEQDQLKELAQRIVDQAGNKGAETAVAHINISREFDLEVRQGEVENLSEAQSHAVSLTVSKQGRRATVSSCDINESHLERMVDDALVMCSYTDSDPFYTMPDRDLLAKEPKDLALYDPGVERLDVNTKIAWARDLEQRFLDQDPRLHTDGAGVSTAESTSVMANSVGFCQGEQRSMVSYGISGFATDEVKDGRANTGRRQSGGWFSQSRHVHDLDDRDAVAARAAHHVIRKLGAQKPETGSFPIYFEPKAARSLWRHLLNAMTGNSIYRKESYLMGQLQQQVCAADITLTDDPTLIRGLGSASFDDEGVACRPMELVTHGRLNHYLLSTYSANKLKMKSTGHAGGVHNIIVKPGTMSENDMIAAMGRGVWVTSLSGQGVNVSTGDYSRAAQGLWIEDGRVAYPIEEFTLNSTLERMFKGICALGNNVESGWSMLTPGLVIDSMTISGS